MKTYAGLRHTQMDSYWERLVLFPSMSLSGLRLGIVYSSMTQHHIAAVRNSRLRNKRHATHTACPQVRPRPKRSPKRHRRVSTLYHQQYPYPDARLVRCRKPDSRHSAPSAMPRNPQTSRPSRCPGTSRPSNGWRWYQDHPYSWCHSQSLALRYDSPDYPPPRAGPPMCRRPAGTPTMRACRLPQA